MLKHDRSLVIFEQFDFLALHITKIGSHLYEPNAYLSFCYKVYVSGSFLPYSLKMVVLGGFIYNV